MDVIRGGEENLNTFNRSTEKVLLSPYYEEKTPLNEMDLYDRSFGSIAIDEGLFTQFTAVV